MPAPSAKRTIRRSDDWLRHAPLLNYTSSAESDFATGATAVGHSFEVGIQSAMSHRGAAIGSASDVLLEPLCRADLAIIRCVHECFPAGPKGTTLDTLRRLWLDFRQAVRAEKIDKGTHGWQHAAA